MQENLQNPNQPELVTPAPARDPVWGYEDLLLMLLLALPSFLLAFGGWKLALWLLHIGPMNAAAEGLPAQFIGYILWFGCLALLLRVKYDASFWASMHWRLPATSALPAVVIGLVLAVAVAVIGALLRTPAIDTPMEALMKDPRARYLIAIAAVTIGPISEELVFRGFLMPLLVRSVGAVGGILLAALPFALLHGPQYSWSWRHVLLVMLAGCAFGWIRHRTGSTAIAAITHAGYNFTFLFVYLLKEEGNSF